MGRRRGATCPRGSWAAAIEEAAKFGSNAIAAGTGLAAYFDRILGRMPDNLVGLLGDYIERVRFDRLRDLWPEARETLHEWGVVEPIDPSPSVLLPLIGAAVDETRDGLKQLWAKLLAAAMDPARTELVRPSLIETLKQMDPLDARMLLHLGGRGKGSPAPGGARYFVHVAEALRVSEDESWVSLQHLHDLGFLNEAVGNISPIPNLTATARLLLKAVSD
jgi:abortive infection alpha-like protein